MSTSVSSPPRQALLASALAAVALLPGVFWGLPTCVAAMGARRILDGGVPYRDFWTMYAPGQFYLSAGLTTVLGPSLLAQSIAAVLIRAATAGVFCLLGRRLGFSRPVSWVATAVFVAAFWKTSPEIDTYGPALLAWLTGMERVVAYFRDGGRGRLFGAGLLFGTASVFKHDVGAYAFAAAAISITSAWHLSGTERRTWWVPPLRAVTAMGAGAFVALAPVVGYLAIVAPADAWADLIVFPATVFRDVRGEPYPSLIPDLAPMKAWLATPSDLGLGRDAFGALAAWAPARLPEAVFLLALATAVRRGARAAALAPALLFAAAIPFFWMAAHVQQNTHLYSMSILSILIGGMAWTGAKPGAAGRMVRGLLLLAFAVLAIGLAAPPAMSAFLVARGIGDCGPLDSPAAAGLRVDRSRIDTYAPILDLIRRHVPPDEPIYCGLGRHDAIVVTNKHFYVLSGRRACTRYYDLHPGVMDRESVQREIIADIEGGGVRCVVLWHFGWPKSTMDRIRDQQREATPDGGSDRLDRHIRSQFTSIWRNREYEVLWRRGIPLPR